MPKKSKTLCVDDLRHAEYYGMQGTFDELLLVSLSRKPLSAARSSEMYLRSTTGNRRQMWRRTRLRQIMTG